MYVIFLPTCRIELFSSVSSKSNEYTDLGPTCFFPIIPIKKNCDQQFNKIPITNKMCLWNTNAPNNGQIPELAKITRTNILISVARSCHKKWLCAIWKLWYFILEVMTNVNFFLNCSKINVKILITVPTERSYLKEYSCEISKLLVS